ncbi:MAG: phosphate ABC transporter permease PstA [Beijerinckiaceae bacterium]
MTDAALTAPRRKHDLTSTAAQALVRKRYAAERRFKFFGVAAVVFAAAFIVFLVSDIVMKGAPAFIEHRLTMKLTPTQQQVAPEGKTDRAALMAADWMPVVRSGIAGYFPEVTQRAQRSKLYNELISSGADVDIRNRIIADPSLIGKPVDASVLLSDDADLYFKGSVTKRQERAGRGAGSPSATTGDVQFTSNANDFVDDVSRIRGDLTRAANLARLEATRLKNALTTVAADRRAALEGQINAQAEKAAELEKRGLAVGGSEKISDNTASILLKMNGGVIKVTEIGNQSISGTVLLPLKSNTEVKSGEWKIITLATPEGSRKLSDQQIAWLDRMKDEGLVSRGFAWRFFTSGDSREPEQAGILGGLIGSALTMLVTLGLCLPIGVGAAIYLEEFAPKNKLTDLIEVNINNLAAVPSIVFGLLGLAMFLNTFDMPRSSPLVGGLVLALLVLPTIIIASRAALKAVPPSIREAALGLGASHQQAVFHHVLPLAMPGILTGTIIGMAHALGETAPLLMIGMVAFIVEVPKSLVESATVLPVQIYLWSDLPEAAFQAKTAGAIIVLLMFLFCMNGAAIWLRKKFEQRW